MQYEEIRTGEAIQLTVEGKIDALSSNDFQRMVLKAFMRCKDVVINLDKVPFMSSAGLRALVLGSKTAEAKGGKLIVMNVQPEVKEVFHYSGIEKILDIM